MSPLPEAKLIATIYSCDCARQIPAGAAYFNLNGVREDQSVAGCSLYQDNIREALRTVGPDGRIQAVLVPEPSNFHDKTAVRVDVLAQGRQLKAGYLPREDAREYFKVLIPLAEAGTYGTTKARPFEGELGIRLYLRPETPDWCLPRPAPTEGAVVLLAERTTAVTGVANYQPASKRFHGRRKPVEKTFSLRVGQQPSGRYAGHAVIEVHAGEELIGRLTVNKSEEYMKPVMFAINRGLMPHAIGEITWSSEKGHRVTLFLPISKYRRDLVGYFYRDDSETDAFVN